MDLCVRAISVGALHKAYPMTVAVGTGAAARIPGTIVYETLKAPLEGDIIRLGHSSGITDVDIKMDGEKVLKRRCYKNSKKDHGWLCIHKRMI